jgi:hypothetical protein
VSPSLVQAFTSKTTQVIYAQWTELDGLFARRLVADHNAALVEHVLNISVTCGDPLYGWSDEDRAERWVRPFDFPAASFRLHLIGDWGRHTRVEV